MADEKLLDEVARIVEPYGCKVVGLGPDAVGVKGDARVYQPSVFVWFPPEMLPERIQKISTEVTNRVAVTRVLQEIILP